MGYCAGLGEHASPNPRRRPRTARQQRRGARRRAKRATVMQRSAIGRMQWEKLLQKVRRGTATGKERRLVQSIIPTPVTVRAIQKKGGLDPMLGEQMRLAREQAAAAAEQRAEAQAAALAEGVRVSEEASSAREQRAMDAAAERERRAADAEAERVLRGQARDEATTLAAEERQLAVEQAEYEREMFQAAQVTGNGYVAPAPLFGGGGGGVPSWRGSANGTGLAPPAPGLDMGKLLPLAAGAALLFLGS